MLHKSYIAVPFFLGLACVAFGTANALKEQKEIELLGENQFLLCDTNGENCTRIKEREKLPIKLTPPLGIKTAVNQSEIDCLARNITQESVKGYIVDKIHVAWGTINRVKLGYASTICGVISQKDAMSWYKNYAKRNAPPRKEDVIIATNILKGNIPNPSQDCMITNWYNITHDSKNSFNAKYKDRIDVCSKHPKNTPHFYLEVRLK